jgi:hypothetical protein
LVSMWPLQISFPTQVYIYLCFPQLSCSLAQQ